MKYIFVINNPITDLITEKLIKSDTEKFNKESVHIFSYRDYKSNLNYSTFSLPILRKKINFILTWVEIKRVKKFINSINDEFVIYLPNSGFEIIQILINHNKCRSYCYIEEGLASYYSVTEKNKFHNNFINRHSNFILKRIRQIYHFMNFGNLVASYSAFFDISSNKYNASYCFSNHCFGEHPNKKLLNISFNKNESLNNIKTVLVLESLVEAGLLKRDIYLSSLDWLLNYLIEKGENTIHYKFHPEQNKSLVSKRAISNLFKKFEQNKNLKFVEISSDLKLEDIAFNSLSSEFYMIVSSVAIYANICGRKSYSFCNQVLNLDPEENFSNYIKTVPSEYFNIVHSLDEK